MSTTPVRRSSRSKKAPTPFTPGAGDFAQGVPSGLLTSTSPEMADAASTATQATPPVPAAATPTATGGGRGTRLSKRFVFTWMLLAYLVADNKLGLVVAGPLGSALGLAWLSRWVEAVPFAAVLLWELRYHSTSHIRPLRSLLSAKPLPPAPVWMTIMSLCFYVWVGAQGVRSKEKEREAKRRDHQRELWEGDIAVLVRPQGGACQHLATCIACAGEDGMRTRHQRECCFEGLAVLVRTGSSLTHNTPLHSPPLRSPLLTDAQVRYSLLGTESVSTPARESGLRSATLVMCALYSLETIIALKWNQTTMSRWARITFVIHHLPFTLCVGGLQLSEAARHVSLVAYRRTVPLDLVTGQ